MKVLIVSDVLGEENNGTTIAAMNLIRYLKSQGEEVRILCADQDKKGVPGYYIVPTIYLGVVANTILKKNNVTLAKIVMKTISQALDGVDIVHGMFPFPLANTTIRMARKRGIPCTMGFHCQAENFSAHIGGMNSKTFNHQVYKVFYKHNYKYVNAIHYPTEFIKDVFEENIKRKTNAYVISNGVNSQFKKIDNFVRDEKFSKHFNILFSGRFSNEKSHHVLVKAVALSKYKDNIQLVFAGKGPTEEKTMKLAEKLGLITPIVGFYKRDELINIINSCDLYVHPAEIEIEAISCLESITCGLVPVISDSVRSATNRFALSEKNLFKCNDSQDLANKIDYWIEHPEEKEQCSKDYLGYTKRFNFDYCMEQMHNMLKTYAKSENHTNKVTYYYKDELNDDFANNGVKAKKVPSNYKYVHHNVFYLLVQFVLYQGLVKNIIRFLNKIKYKQKFINHMDIKPSKLGGCFIYANHTADIGDAFTPNLIRRKRNNIITSPEAVSIAGLRTVVAMLGAMPLPSTLQGTKNYLNGIQEKIKKGESITIYPEAHIWPYYTKIRNFSANSFKYPYEVKAPSICLTNTYILVKNKVHLVTHIDGPFYIDESLPKEEAINKLRDDIYNTMVRRSTEVDQVEVRRYINLNDIAE